MKHEGRDVDGGRHALGLLSRFLVQVLRYPRQGACSGMLGQQCRCVPHYLLKGFSSASQLPFREGQELDGTPRSSTLPSSHFRSGQRVLSPLAFR